MASDKKIRANRENAIRRCALNRRGARGDAKRFGAQHLLLVPEISDAPMDKSAISETLRELRREISDIQSENRAFWAHTTHTRLEIQLHEKRRGRLKEIREEISALVRKPG